MKICFKKSYNLYVEFILCAQSYTSMKADLHQETNGGFTRSMYLKWINFLKKVPHKGLGKLTQKRRFVFITLLIWVNVTLLPITSRACSINATAK